VSNDEKFLPTVVEETMHLFDLLQVEYKVPPMYSCLKLAKICSASIISGYARQDKQPPPELLEFVDKVLDAIEADQADFIQEQFLTLHTEGHA
jgi:hypothetical protein